MIVSSKEMNGGLAFMGTAALTGKRIVIAGSQKTNEMSVIIAKQGGTPLVRSLQGLTVFDESLLAEPLQQLAREGADWVILTTGIGAESLVNASEKLGVRERLLAVFSQSKIASRGYKTTAFLKRNGLQAVVNDEDGTILSLMGNLETRNFDGERVWIQLHGEPAPELEQFLRQKGALLVQSVLPYRHSPPAINTLEQLLSELEGGAVDAVCFTTGVQVNYLFRYALEQGRVQALLQAFNGPALAAAVGKVTAQALKEYGVERMIVPETERMGAMIIAISQYYERMKSDR